MTQHQMLNVADGLPIDFKRVYRCDYTHPCFICTFQMYLEARSEEGARDSFAFNMPGMTLKSVEVR